MTDLQECRQYWGEKRWKEMREGTFFKDMDIKKFNEYMIATRLSVKRAIEYQDDQELQKKLDIKRRREINTSKCLETKRITRMNRLDQRGHLSCQERRSLRKVPWGRNSERMYELKQNASKWGMSLDHVIPLQGKLVSGLDVWANIQLMDRSMNSAKNNKFDIDVYNAE